ncbi:hypothetical protein J2X60_002414 [Curtobacterium sp. 320]|uniref:hypothetical protein n=1 Tax=Curtobacterium sp. 320 TaxID=2817749 RepID=UPI002857FDBD|nr:hypothetical protein [Curtobacterium sp. 320]MDR6573760.1 hypothetical protein [Curtobacterium sp. 320]
MNALPLVLGLVLVVGGLACIPWVVQRNRNHAPSDRGRLIAVVIALVMLVAGALLLR